jgi:hypothetical protein
MSETIRETSWTSIKKDISPLIPLKLKHTKVRKGLFKCALMNYGNQNKKTEVAYAIRTTKEDAENAMLVCAKEFKVKVFNASRKDEDVFRIKQMDALFLKSFSTKKNQKLRVMLMKKYDNNTMNSKYWYMVDYLVYLDE